VHHQTRRALEERMGRHQGRNVEVDKADGKGGI
jgi:hypothetical protein